MWCPSYRVHLLFNHLHSCSAFPSPQQNCWWCLIFCLLSACLINTCYAVDDNYFSQSSFAIRFVHSVLLIEISVKFFLRSAFIRVHLVKSTCLIFVWLAKIDRAKKLLFIQIFASILQSHGLFRGICDLLCVCMCTIRNTIEIDLHERILVRILMDLCWIRELHMIYWVLEWTTYPVCS